ncbi:YbaB/EbfC family nucleoid-associated protein [Patescibacteria group bacterium]|nr:YbaB/EbfC family nucleoid-associated protein [Patescibacteria group bacterium]
MLSKLKQFKDLKKQASDLKSSLAEEEAVGESKGGLVKITMDGNQEIQNVEVDESLLASDQKETLESAIKEAFAKAIKEVQSLMIRKMQSGEIQMPNL